MRSVRYFSAIASHKMCKHMQENRKNVDFIHFYMKQFGHLYNEYKVTWRHGWISSMVREMTDQWCKFLHTGTTNLVCSCLFRDKVRHLWHTAFPLPWCVLFTLRMSGKNAPDWPWQRVALASFPSLLPFLWPYVTGLIFGMLLMSELGGIPSCWMLGPVSLKTQHQKWDTWKWLTQLSQESRHFN